MRGGPDEARSPPTGSPAPEGVPDRAARRPEMARPRDPELSRWGGGRLDIEWSAVAVSVVLHGMLLLTLAMVGYAANSEGRSVLEGRIVDTALPDLERSGFQDLDQSDERPADGPPPARSRRTSRRWRSRSPRRAGPPPPRWTWPRRVRPSWPRSTCDAHRGRGADGRDARPIGLDQGQRRRARRRRRGGRRPDRRGDPPPAGEGRTLVIWAFDASGSLQAERQRLSKHIETVYTHIKQLDEKELASDDGLLTLVVSFGHDRKALTPEPTADPAAIISAIDSVAARHHRRRVDVPDRPGDRPPLGAGIATTRGTPITR